MEEVNKKEEEITKYVLGIQQQHGEPKPANANQITRVKRKNLKSPILEFLMKNKKEGNLKKMMANEDMGKLKNGGAY